jgi:CrcB protein
MSKLLLVGAGGFIGSALRYLIGGLVQQSSIGAKFPLGTLAVNLIGCFVIGLLSQLVDQRSLFSAEMKAFIFIGVLGGFTTFSSFGNETIDLWRADKEILALTNIGAHVFICLFAVCVGRAAAKLI